MTRSSLVILCLSYIIGLLSTNLVTFSGSGFNRQQLLLLGVISIGISAIASLIISAVEYNTPVKKNAILLTLKASYKRCLGATVMAILAIIYLQLRIPQPNIDDISYQVTASESQWVTLSGKVLTEPRLNDSQKLKFLLETTEIGDQEKVSGKIYATLPLLQGTGLHPGTRIKLKGILYLPQGANLSSGFDFRIYLARQGIFAGIKGFSADFETEAKWGWWQLRQRIVRSQLKGLGSPTGQLVSSMVLGRKAVDLSGDIRDRFVEAGLAHVLAASGFHVSLLLGIILRLTTSFTAKTRLIIGVITLIIYLGLTGVQASVFRACLMGVAVLIALVMETKVKPLGSLLVAATIILLVNPVFIADLGFQLSFLATFGLIVTMPGLQAKLDWLPPTIATLIAVPLAASIWVLPLLSYGFNRVATYSIIVNVVCTPLITLISLGGMISALAALIVPFVGSAIAWLLLYPTLLLTSIINFFTSLPGSSWAIGQISLGALLTIYCLFILVWLNQWWRKQIGFVSLFILTLIIIPVINQHLHLTQITILPAQPEPVVVIRDRGKVILINSGTSKTVKYTVLPFLTHQGINHLDYGIDLNPEPNSDWEQISDRLKIEHFIPHPNSAKTFIPNIKDILIQNSTQAIVTKSFQISLNSQLSLLKLETATETWLILNNSERDSEVVKQYIQDHSPSPKQLILIGQTIPLSWLEIQPQAIVSFEKNRDITRRDANNIQFYNLKQNGAVFWTPKNGIQLLMTSHE